MMDCSFPLWSPSADSAALHYDAVQLNRIECMLMQLMMKLSGKDDVLKLFTQSRHSGGVVALLTQSYTLLNRSARLQATHLAVWAVQHTQWTQIRDELAGRQGMSREQLDQAWSTATSRHHGLLSVQVDRW